MEQFSQPTVLEQDAMNAINRHDFETFERYGTLHYKSTPYNRRVVQLKALYRNTANMVPTEKTYVTIGLYLLYLLASDRIGKSSSRYTPIIFFVTSGLPYRA